jgi:cobalt-zinc-cadmium efflux system outer membrane protein
MAKKAHLMAACLVLLAIFGGCASMDTSQRLGQVENALKLPKGVELIWQKQEKDAALVKQKVDQALRDGLTQEEAVAVALINNQGLQASLEELGISQAELVQAGLFHNPTLGALVRFPLDGDEDGTNVELSLGFNLADAWQVPLRKDVAQAALSRATLEVAQMVLDIRRDTKAAYARVYYLGQALKIHQRANRLMAQILEAARRRQRFGYMTDMETQQLAAETAMTGLEQARIAMELSQAKNSLLRLLGMTGHTGEPGLFEVPLNDASSPPPLDEALALAQSRRVDLRLAQVRAAQARHMLRLEKARIIKEAAWE